MFCGLYKTPVSPESSSHSAVYIDRERKIRIFAMSGTSNNRNEFTVHARLHSSELPSPEGLGYTLGKTLGSGTYAKVKAAWSPFERKMVSPTPPPPPHNIAAS